MNYDKTARARVPEILPIIRKLYETKVPDKKKRGKLKFGSFGNYAYFFTIETDDLRYYDSGPIKGSDMEKYLETGDEEAEQKIIEALENITFRN